MSPLTPQDLGLTAAQVAATRLPLAQASVLPPLAYADERIFALERERLFARTWMPVCHVSQLPQPGDYVERTLVGEPVLALRGKDGGVRVMSNVCRHRNTTLAKGHGNFKGNRITCPYHGWSYGLEGQLLAAPFMEGVENFERREIALQTYRSEVWQGFVFVNLDGQAPSLASQVEGLVPEIAPYRFDEVEAVELRRNVVPWNWKVSLENFSEAYHQPWVHPVTVDQDMPAKSAVYHDVSGPYGLFLIHEKNGNHLPTFFPPPADMPDRLLSLTTVFNVYPYLHVLTDPTAGVWLDFNITGPHEHEMVWHALVPKGSAARGIAKELEAMVNFFNPILAEDVGVCTGVAAGVKSRHVTPGRYSLMEKTLHQFHNWWLDTMLGDR